jgi:putative intracellular protease/amidase
MKETVMELTGNLITSRKPDDLPAFMRAIIDAMGKHGQ